MTDAEQVAGLEAALVAQAQKLAREYLADGRRAGEHIVNDANERLRLREQSEILAAQAHSERLYRQRVQAAEINMRAELDRLRWTLVTSVLESLPQRLAEYAGGEQRYLALLHSYLRQGGDIIERQELIAQVNQRDFGRLRSRWSDWVREVLPYKTVTLSDNTIDCIGGVLISSADNQIRIDNTFEGRIERLLEPLQLLATERLFPSTLPTSGEVLRG